MATGQVKADPRELTGDTEDQGKVQEVASQAIDKTQEKAQDVKGQVSARARTELDTRSTQLGEQVTSVVQALRKTGEQLQGEGNEIGGRAVQAMADRAERLGGYLRNLNADRLTGDLESFGRRRPWRTAGLGVAAGFMASRFLKASAANRYEASRQSRSESDAPPTHGGYEPPASASYAPAGTGGERP
jgi:ElaB/YqjD/DUF883 family membrane-anchored ribosome-binding protein